MPIMKFDMMQEGLLAVFKSYQATLMEHIWDQNLKEKVGITSGEAHKLLKDNPERKSRASVIIFLNNMVEEGILGYELKTGKGGYHRVYYPLMDRDGFQKFISEKINGKLEKLFS
jgi:predicted transcriptional regulator